MARLPSDPRRARHGDVLAEVVALHQRAREAGWAYRFVITWLVPIEFVLMFGWWMFQAATVYDPDGWWNPTHVYSVGTCVVQWGAALALLLAFNRKIAAASTREQVEVTS